MSTARPIPLTPGIPPLEPGDRLSREEFERRYQAMPNLKKAELIEGVVHMPSPTRWGRHARQHGRLLTWFGVYQVATPGVDFGDSGTLRLDLDNEPQPDAAMIVEPACGGQVRISDDDYIIGAPELVAEVAASSVSIDLNKKLAVYRRNEVREYVVWRVLDEEIDWFVLRQSEFARLEPQANILRSETFPGLWLNVPAMVQLDMASVLATLQFGLASPEHAAFVARLETLRP